jgi:hypothetical protein
MRNLQIMLKNFKRSVKLNQLKTKANQSDTLLVTEWNKILIRLICLVIRHKIWKDLFQKET